MPGRCPLIADIRRPLACVCGVLILASVWVATVDAGEQVGDPFLAVGASVLGRSSDALTVSDLEPHLVSTPGGEAELAARLGCRWSVVTGGTVGGSWFTFAGPGIKGRTSYVEWTARVGLRRPVWQDSRREVDFGVFYEYGEQNSWLENLVLSRSGAHGFRSGGGVRLTGVGPRWWYLRPCLAVERSEFRAHASDATTGNQYAWIGSSTLISLGVRLEMSKTAAR